MMKWQEAQETQLKRLIEHKRLGLISDMDGTLSPIVPRPEDATITPRNRELLAQLHEPLSLVALVSGRAALDLHARVGLPQLVYVGNHGLEQWQDGGVSPVPEAAGYRPALEAAIEAIRPQLAPGMQIEDKTITLSIHYRRAEAPDAIAEQYRPFVAAVAEEHGLKFFEGRRIFELRPPIDIDKGSAMHRLCIDYDLDGALYLGDDVTDVDALKVARQLRRAGTCYALAVGVVSDSVPDSVVEASDLLVEGVSDVESFLSWLLSSVKA